MSKEAMVSFEDIVNEFSDQLMVYLKRMVGNPEDANDLFQETLMKIANNLVNFEYRSSIKTWVYKITTNVAYDYFRKKKNLQLVTFDENETSSNDNECDRIVLDEMNICVREVINKMPIDYRTVTILYNLQGKSIAEVAEICDISVENAKIRIHRAKKQLKEILSRECVFYKTDDGNLRCDRK